MTSDLVHRKQGLAQHVLVAVLLLVASLAYWQFFRLNDGRELRLWSIFGRVFGEPFIIGPERYPFLKVIGALAITFALGGALSRVAIAPFLPRLARLEWLCVSGILGIATIGIFGELLAIAGLLNMVAVILVLLIFGAILLAVEFLWNRPYVKNRNQSRAQEGKAAWPDDAAHPASKICAIIFLTLFGLIFFFIFWHALLYPVTYWDAMILYVGFAKRIFLLEAVPEVVVGQVGVGLGANYPHLFAFYHVSMAKLFGNEWTPAFAQVVSPVCGLLVSGFIYSMVRRLGGGRWAASGAILLSVSFHYIIAYYQYASNYPLAMALTALYLWAGLLHLQHRNFGAIALAILAAAVAVHVNYLMWLFWIAGLALTALSSDRRALFTGKRYWLVVIAGLLLASPWYIRNVIVTGNPVYSFYANIFPSKNVNPEVMESAGYEWLRNGDGIATHAHGQKAQRLALQDIEDAQQELTIENFDKYYAKRHAEDLTITFADKVQATPAFLATGGQAYKVGPVFLGFMIPGFCLVLFYVANSFFRGRERANSAQSKFYIWSALLFGLFFFYHYGVAGYYLYQILPFIVIGGLFIGAILIIFERQLWSMAYSTILIIAIGLVPGLAFGIMGLKTFRGGPDLFAFHRPLMAEEEFYALRYGGDIEMLNYINLRLAGEPLLTHENRLLAIDPSIQVVQLDDWEMQALYDLPTPEEKLQGILDAGIRYYLKVPNEDKHPVNLRLEIQKFIGTPHLKEIYRTQGAAGLNTLYRISDIDAGN